MSNDVVQEMIDQWSDERPDLETESLGVVVRVMHLAKAFVRQGSAALEPLGLELFEYDVLSALRRQGEPYALAASQLATQGELSTGAMTNRIDKLERRGLVQRVADKSDRRAVIVRLTRKGLGQIEKAIEVRMQAADDSLSALSKTEIHDLSLSLGKLARPTY
ncbi:MAG: MarR family transcriptional regulator [Pseudomonadota bacterium]